MLDFIFAGVLYLVVMFLVFSLVSFVVIGGAYGLVMVLQRFMSRIRRIRYASRVM